MKESIGFSIDVLNAYQHASPLSKPICIHPDQAFKDYWFWKYGRHLEENLVFLVFKAIEGHPEVSAS